MFNKINSYAVSVRLVSGDLMDGNVTYAFSLNSVQCELSVKSHVQLVSERIYTAISVSLTSNGNNLFYSEIATTEERSEMLKMLSGLDSQANAWRRKSVAQLAKDTGIFE